MDFQQSIKVCFQKYATFEGRAGRQELWWFALFQFIVMIVGGIVLKDWLAGLVNLALFLPGLAVFTRRLHDIGKSGWYQLLWFIPLIGWGLTYPFNLTGHPAASVPAGLIDGRLPVGMQIVGPRGDDAGVLRASAVFEQIAPWDAAYRIPRERPVGRRA